MALNDKTENESPKLAEFRERNIALMKEVESLRPLKARLAEIEAEDAEDDAADAAEAQSLAAQTKRAADLTAQLTSERAAHAQTQLKHVVTTEFLRVGGRASAVDYMAAEAAKVFVVEDGKLAAKDPASALSLAEWMLQQTSVQDWLFQPSRGGGSRGSTLPARFGGRSNQKTLTNPTPQALGANASAIASGEIKVNYTE